MAHFGQSLKFDIPGPGQYPHDSIGSKRPRTNAHQRSKSTKLSVVFDSTDRRFKAKGPLTYFHQTSTNQAIGPGAYINLENSLIKKSYNMTVEHSYFV